jgi:hypothetical protein
MFLYFNADFSVKIEPKIKEDIRIATLRLIIIIGVVS